MASLGSGKFNPALSQDRPLIKAWNELRAYQRYKDTIACAKEVTNQKEIEELLEYAMWFAFSYGRMGARVSQLSPVINVVQDSLKKIENFLAESGAE